MSRNYYKPENIQENSISVIKINCLTYHLNAFCSKGLDTQCMIIAQIVRRQLFWTYFKENQVFCWRIFHMQLLKQFSKGQCLALHISRFFLFPHIFWEWRSQNTYISIRCLVLYFLSWPSVWAHRKEGIFMGATHITEWLTIMILKKLWITQI